MLVALSNNCLRALNSLESCYEDTVDGHEHAMLEIRFICHSTVLACGVRVFGVRESFLVMGLFGGRTSPSEHSACQESFLVKLY